MGVSFSHVRDRLDVETLDLFGEMVEAHLEAGAGDKLFLRSDSPFIRRASKCKAFGQQMVVATSETRGHAQTAWARGDSPTAQGVTAPTTTKSSGQPPEPPQACRTRIAFATAEWTDRHADALDPRAEPRVDSDGGMRTPSPLAGFRWPSGCVLPRWQFRFGARR